MIDLVIAGKTIHHGNANNVIMTSKRACNKVVVVKSGKSTIVWQRGITISIPSGVNIDLKVLATQHHVPAGTNIDFVLPHGHIVGSTNNSDALTTGNLSAYGKIKLLIQGEIQAGLGYAFRAASHVEITSSGAIRGNGGTGGHGGAGKASSKKITTTKTIKAGKISSIINQKELMKAVNKVSKTTFQGLFTFRRVGNQFGVFGACGKSTTLHERGETATVCGIRFTLAQTEGDIASFAAYYLQWTGGKVNTYKTVHITGGHGGVGGTGIRYKHGLGGGTNGVHSNPAGGNSGGKGGAGGSWGAHGHPGAVGGGNGTSGRTLGTAPHAAVWGIHNITWKSKGTVNGTIV